MNGVVYRGQSKDVENQSGACEVDARLAQHKLGEAGVVHSEDRLGKKYNVEIIRYRREGYPSKERDTCHG